MDYAACLPTHLALDIFDQLPADDLIHRLPVVCDRFAESLVPLSGLCRRSLFVVDRRTLGDIFDLYARTGAIFDSAQNAVFIESHRASSSSSSSSLSVKIIETFPNIEHFSAAIGIPNNDDDEEANLDHVHNRVSQFSIIENILDSPAIASRLKSLNILIVRLSKKEKNLKIIKNCKNSISRNLVGDDNLGDHDDDGNGDDAYSRVWQALIRRLNSGRFTRNLQRLTLYDGNTDPPFVYDGQRYEKLRITAETLGGLRSLTYALTPMRAADLTEIGSFLTCGNAKQFTLLPPLSSSSSTSSASTSASSASLSSGFAAPTTASPQSITSITSTSTTNVNIDAEINASFLPRIVAALRHRQIRQSSRNSQSSIGPNQVETFRYTFRAPIAYAHIRSIVALRMQHTLTTLHVNVYAHYAGSFLREPLRALSSLVALRRLRLDDVPAPLFGSQFDAVYVKTRSLHLVPRLPAVHTLQLQLYAGARTAWCTARIPITDRAYEYGANYARSLPLIFPSLHTLLFDNLQLERRVSKRGEKSKNQDSAKIEKSEKSIDSIFTQTWLPENFDFPARKSSSRDDNRCDEKHQQRQPARVEMGIFAPPPPPKQQSTNKFLPLSTSSSSSNVFERQLSVFYHRNNNNNNNNNNDESENGNCSKQFANKESITPSRYGRKPVRKILKIYRRLSEEKGEKAEVESDDTEDEEEEPSLPPLIQNKKEKLPNENDQNRANRPAKCRIIKLRRQLSDPGCSSSSSSSSSSSLLSSFVAAKNLQKRSIATIKSIVTETSQVTQPKLSVLKNHNQTHVTLRRRAKNSQKSEQPKKGLLSSSQFLNQLILGDLAHFRFLQYLRFDFERSAAECAMPSADQLFSVISDLETLRYLRLRCSANYFDENLHHHHQNRDKQIAKSCSLTTLHLDRDDCDNNCGCGGTTTIICRSLTRFAPTLTSLRVLKHDNLIAQNAFAYFELRSKFDEMQWYRELRQHFLALRQIWILQKCSENVAAISPADFRYRLTYLLPAQPRRRNNSNSRQGSNESGAIEDAADKPLIFVQRAIRVCV